MLNLAKCFDLNLSLPAEARQFRFRAPTPAEGEREGTDH